MLLLIMVILLVVALWKDWDDDGTLMVAFGLLLALAVPLVLIGHNICWRNKIIANQAKIAVYQERIDALLPQVRAELDKYPEHERGALRELANGKPVLLFAPSFKANETIMAAAKEIKAANDKVYACKLDTIDCESAIRVNKSVGPWFGWVW